MTKRVVSSIAAAAVVAACGSSPPRPPATSGPRPPLTDQPADAAPADAPPPATVTTPGFPALAMVADAPCTIAENGKTRNKLVLRYGGAPFAAIDTYDGADLELAASGATATMHVVTAELDLTGEVDLHELHARPRATEPIDDWITIVDGVVTGVTGSSITIEPHLNFVTLAGATTWTVPCAEATLTRYPPDPCCGDYVPDIRWLPRGGAVDIDREPGQTRLGTIRIAKKGDPWDGRVERFETKGAWSHVTYDDGDVIITGWVKTAVLRTKKQDYGNGRGLYGHVVGPVRDGDLVRCDHPVDVSVERDGKTVRAGSIKAGTPINLYTIGDQGGYVDLGLSSDDRIDPTVPVDQLVGCPSQHVGPK